MSWQLLVFSAIVAVPLTVFCKYLFLFLSDITYSILYRQAVLHIIEQHKEDIMREIYKKIDTIAIDFIHEGGDENKSEKNSQ